MLFAFIPLVFAWLAGKGGRITWADGFFALHAVWIFLALMANHGFSQFNFAMISIVEIFGAYLLGRIAVRGPRSYRTFIRYHFIALLCFLPFILIEMETSNALVQDVFQTIFGRSYGDINHDPRAGFWRAQGPFVHPILWGVFCSIAIANAYYLMKPSRFKGIFGRGFRPFHDVLISVIGTVSRRRLTGSADRLGRDHPQQMEGARHDFGGNIRLSLFRLEPRPDRDRDRNAYLQFRDRLDADHPVHPRHRRK